MNNGIWIILGVGIVSYGVYRLYKSYSKKEGIEKSVPKVKPEVVEQLGMLDVIGYFKTLHLDKDNDKPFIAIGDVMKDLINLSESDYAGFTFICLGNYKNSSDNLENLKVLACKEVGTDVLEILGNDKLVTLS